MCLIIGIAALAGFAGCNIFGEDGTPASGEQAAELQEQLDAFLSRGSRSRISSDLLYRIAKESRIESGIGVLVAARQVSSMGESYPFEYMTPAERGSSLVSIMAVEKALGVLLYGHKAALDDRMPTSPFEEPDPTLRLAAPRVRIESDAEPCDFYPDFIAACILRITLDFRVRLETILPGVQIEPDQSGQGYRILPPAGMTSTELAAKQNEINELLTWFDGELDRIMSHADDPLGTFACDAIIFNDTLDERVILSITEMKSYISDALRNITVAPVQ